MEACPTCGRPMPRRHTLISREGDLLAELRKRRDSEVYRIKGTDQWAITHRKGIRVDSDLVSGLVKARVLRPTYLGLNDSFGLGPTIDVEATIEARRRSGIRTQIVYA